jgi:hypothetical protein
VAGWAAWAGARRAIAQAAVCLLAALAVISPWTIRNAVVMDAPILISTNLGDDLCIGHNPVATGWFQFSPHCEGPQEADRKRREVRRNSANTSAALRFMVRNPRREVELVGLRASHLFVGDHDGLWASESYGEDQFLGRRRVYPGLVRIADWYYYGVALLALVGLPGFLRREPRRLLLLLSMAGLLLTPLAFFGDMRFHVPAMPLVALVAAVPVARLAGALADRLSRRPAPAPAASERAVEAGDRTG